MRRRRAQLLVGAAVAVVLALAATSLAVAGGGHDGKGKNKSGDFVASLDGFQETPSLNSTGSAKFSATVESDKITYKLDWEGLSGPPLFAHVHVGQRGVAGGVSFFLCGGGGKPQCTQATSGSASGTVVAADVVGPAGQGFNPGDLASVIAAIKAGVTYANIHTTKFPAGEIRGQLDRGHGHHGGKKDD